MSFVIAVANEKGGVGKTTMTGNLGHALAKRGKKTLVIDMDPQVNLTTWLGRSDLLAAIRRDAGVGTDGAAVAIAAPVTMDRILVDSSLLGDSPAPTVAEGVDMIYGDERLAAVQVELLSRSNAPLTVLRRTLRALDGYDIVLIDCPPSLSTLYANAITAANAVLVPVQPARWAIDGLNKVLASIRELVQDEVIPEEPVVRVIVSNYDGFDPKAQEREQEIRERRDIVVLETKIRKASSLTRIVDTQKTIFDAAPTSAGAVDYDALAQELLS